ERPRPLEQRAIVPQACEAKIRPARLPRPEQRARAPQLEVSLRQLEPVGRVDERLEPLLCDISQLLLRARDQEAVRLLGAATAPASQLMKLGEPKAVGFLHDHDRRVGDVDTDLDHGRGHQYVQFSSLETSHQLAPFGGPQLTVQAADAEARELSTP